LAVGFVARVVFDGFEIWLVFFLDVYGRLASDLGDFGLWVCIGLQQGWLLASDLGILSSSWRDLWIWGFCLMCRRFCLGDSALCVIAAGLWLMSGVGLKF
jgi:hypothetical protein